MGARTTCLCAWIRMDPQYDESQLIRAGRPGGNETGVFRAYSTIRELVVDVR